jgi:hypothetical protein
MATSEDYPTLHPDRREKGILRKCFQKKEEKHHVHLFHWHVFCEGKMAFFLYQSHHYFFFPQNKKHIVDKNIKTNNTIITI